MFLSKNARNSLLILLAISTMIYHKGGNETLKFEVPKLYHCRRQPKVAKVNCKHFYWNTRS